VVDARIRIATCDVTRPESATTSERAPIIWSGGTLSEVQSTSHSVVDHTFGDGAHIQKPEVNVYVERE
jgi:hypothetical protein